MFQEFPSWAFWFQPVWGSCDYVQCIAVNIHVSWWLGGEEEFLVPAEQLKDAYQITLCVSLVEEAGTRPGTRSNSFIAELLSLLSLFNCYPLFLHSLSFLLSNCLSLLLDLREGLGDKAFSTNNKGENEGAVVLGVSHRVLPSFSPLFHWYCSTPRGTDVGQDRY